ncbi:MULTISPECIES: alpha/beta hydrolase family protein [unclassified Sphingobium]|uniref:alpha/beta hydrolase family protein n=1 Tax=unclassified Sphingobium TaxID=2611147 RepID=UPI0035A6BD54
MTIDLTLEGKASDARFDFSVAGDDGMIPATFWNAREPAGASTPVTLLQHGGPFHKRHERTDWLAAQIVERTGSAVLLIDGPIHGRRGDIDRDVMEMLGVFERHWRNSPGIERYVAEWRTVLDVVLEQGWADADRVAWFGMSMGTAYGIPLCAAEQRIKGAVLGMWGLDWGQDAVLLHNARMMRTPVLFQIKSEDEIFSTDGQRALFDAIGSPDKCLHTFTGGHSLTAPGQLDELLDFITHALAPDATRSADRERPISRA